MKKLLLIIFLSATSAILYAQQGKKATDPKPTSQPDMNKLLEDAMKEEGMSKEEQEEMKKLMKDVMPALAEQNAKTADYPEFTSNKQLVPKKDATRIASILKKTLTQADMAAYAANLHNKILLRGKQEEKNIIKQVLAKTSNAAEIHTAAMLAMMQGHPEAAMALTMKSVQLNPANINYQNNMAALLTQYGYPEQALPVLQKIKQQYPANSTVLNNLAHAWLGLGETDSVKKFTSLAMRVNPAHPEASLCGGLMQELMGDPVKASDYYQESMDQAPNLFTETMQKNAGKKSGSEIPDWEKIRRSIAIYEYFPKNWIKTSILTPSVGSYVHNKSLKEGYEKADEEFDAKLETIINELSKEIESLANQGEETFVKELGKEMMKGVNFMSKPAVLVLKVLHQYGADMLARNSQDMIELHKKIDGFRAEYRNATKNATKCQTYDAAKNKLMQNVNPLVHKFYTEKAEECRQWLNALATWNWYLVGNVKNTVLLQDMGYVAALETYYNEAMYSQLAESSDCSPQKEIAPADIPPHNIPNFTCPAIVSIPVGPEWQKLTSASYDFNKNAHNIAKSATAIPNASLGYATSNIIAQPGKGGAFVKTANGSITPGNINTDMELEPITKIEKDWDLTPLPKIPLDDLTPLPDLSKSRYAKQLLEKMMTADCKGVRNSKDILKEELDKMMKSVKELDAHEELLNEIKKFGEDVEGMEAEMEKKNELKSKIDKFQQEVDKLDRYDQWQESKKNLERMIKELDAMDDKRALKDKISKFQSLVDEMENAPAALKDIQQNGIQTTISSGLQAPGTFSPVKGLFQ
jgi:tetratricopeptide (TPR) repeat protein